MNRAPIPPLFALLAALCLPAAASAEVHLKPKFTPGKAAVDLETRFEQKLSIGGADYETKVEQFGKVGFEAKKPDADGNVTVTQKFTSLQAWMQMPGGVKFQFDSGSPDAGGDDLVSDTMRGIFKTLHGTTYTFVHDDDGRVIDARAARPRGAQVDPNLEELFDPHYWKQVRQQELDRLPDGPVNKGDTWKRTAISRFGGGQTMTFEMVYKYEGRVTEGDKTYDRITGVVKAVKYEIANNGANPFTIDKANLKIKESKTELLFDREAGVTVKTNDTVHIIGDVTMTADDQKYEATLDLKIESRTKLN